MDTRDAANRDLLFGLLALQNGLIDASILVAAFRAWTCDKSKPIAEILGNQGSIDDEERALLEGLAKKHLQRHGSETEKSLAAVAIPKSVSAILAGIGDADIDATIGHVSGSNPTEPATTGPAGETISVGDSAGDGRRFRLLRPHARGGLGEVFVALDSELNREVALKQILQHHADEPISRTRFLIEAEITGGLEHPGIVPVYGLGRDSSGRPYYAMRFIRGDTLKEAIAGFHGDEALKNDPGKRSLALRKLLRRFLDVCNAMEYAHSRGVIHRDLKPANVIVGQHGETLVIDWGLAKPLGRPEVDAGSDERTLIPSTASGSAETLPGSALGSPSFMSPEQAAGDLEKIGPRSDVYSLGATLYTVLTGKAPFEGLDIGSVLRGVKKGDFARPRKLDPTIDPALEAICLKAMATDPEGRYGSCRALAEDLERWSADEPVSIYVEPFGRRARRWMRRNRTAVTAAAVALVAGLVGLASVVAVETRANARLTKTNDALEKANAETRIALEATRKAQVATAAALAETRKAQAETTKALAQSEESRKQAEAVGSFLVDTFKKPDPSVDGKDVRLADLLDQALEGLNRGFSGSKQTEGALFDALGRSYFGLGLYQKAEETHRKALAIREVALGLDHRDTMGSTGNLAEAYRETGRIAEAIALHESNWRRLESKLGPDHAETLATRGNLAYAYLAAGRTTDAIALGESTLKLRESKLGPNHHDTLASRQVLGSAYRVAGRMTEAIAMFQEALKGQEATQGLDHPDTLVTSVNLANALVDAGRMAEAVTRNESTLHRLEVKLGPEHPTTLTARSNLARAYLRAGKATQAIALDEQTLKLKQAILGRDHPNTLTTRANLATAYQYLGRVAEAIALDEVTLKLYEAKLGRDHPSALTTRSNLAAAYSRAGRLDEAIALNEQTLKLKEAKLGPDHPDTLLSRGNLGADYTTAGRIVEAIALNEQTLKLREAKLGVDHPDTLVSRSTLASAYRAAGRIEEAIALDEVTLKLRQAKLGADHPSTLTTRQNLALAYRMTGRAAEATALDELTLKLREAKLGGDHPDTLNIRLNLAVDYETLKRWADAETLHRDNLERRRRLEKTGTPNVAADLATLGRNLLNQSKWSEAELLLRESLAIRIKAIPDDYRRFNTESLLGRALLAQGQFAAAEPLIVGGYEGMKAREAKIPASGKLNLTEAGDRVVQLYRSWGKPEQAGAWSLKLGLIELPRDVFAK